MATDLNPLLAYLAGVLTILSPCVLPLVPIVLTGAQSKGRWGPVALGLGLTLSFTAVGLFVALIGFSIGLDGEVFRVVGGKPGASPGSTQGRVRAVLQPRPRDDEKAGADRSRPAPPGLSLKPATGIAAPRE